MKKRYKQTVREMTVEKARRYFHYDKETGVLTWAVDRNRLHVGDKAGSLDTKGRRRILCEGRSYSSTTLIWMIVFGRKPIGQIDHKNLVRDDDRLKNLREVTASQNCMNKRHNGVLPRGVSFYPQQGIYAARITVQRKTKYLGSFSDKEQAAQAYAKASKELHGDFRFQGSAP